MSAVTVIAAAASSAAAVFSGISLWLVSRREQRKWVRDASLEHLYAFVMGSFRAAINPIWEARSNAPSVIPDHLVLRREESRRQMNEALTMMRLIVSRSEVITYAESLMTLEKQLYELVETADPTDSEVQALFRRKKSEHTLARQNFIDHARASLFVPGRTALTDRYRSDDGPHD